MTFGLVNFSFSLPWACYKNYYFLCTLASQSHKMLQTFVWWGGGGGHHTNICKFLQLPRAISLLAKDVSLSKMAISLILLKALFPVVSMDFPSVVHVES